MSDTLVIVVHGTPSKLLTVNAARRTHYMAKAKVSKAMRTVGWAAARELVGEGVRFAGSVRVTETVYWGKGERSVDLDTIAPMCKPYLDGFTDAGVWVDDKQMVELTVRQERASDGVGRVRIVVEGVS